MIIRSTRFGGIWTIVLLLISLTTGCRESSSKLGASNDSEVDNPGVDGALINSERYTGLPLVFGESEGVLPKDSELFLDIGALLRADDRTSGLAVEKVWQIRNGRYEVYCLVRNEDSIGANILVTKTDDGSLMIEEIVSWEA